MANSNLNDLKLITELREALEAKEIEIFELKRKNEELKHVNADLKSECASSKNLLKKNEEKTKIFNTNQERKKRTKWKEKIYLTR